MATDILTAIDTAVVAALAAESVTCYPYESPALSKVPCATFVLESWESDYMMQDQAEGFGELTYKLRYYVSALKDYKLAWADVRTGLQSIRAALGADPTLTGAVRDTRINGGRIVPVQTANGSRPELMCEVDVSIRPKPHID